MLSWESQPKAQMSQFQDIPAERKSEHHQVTHFRPGQLAKSFHPGKPSVIPVCPAPSLNQERMLILRVSEHCSSSQRWTNAQNLVSSSSCTPCAINSTLSPISEHVLG